MITLGEIAGILTPILRREAVLTERMRNLQRFSIAFAENQTIRLVDRRLMGLVEDTMPSCFSAGNLRATYIRYDRGEEVMTKPQSMPSFLTTLGWDVPDAKGFAINDLDDLELHIPSREDILRRIQAAYELFKKTTNLLFACTCLYITLLRSLDQLRLCKFKEH